MTTIRLARDSDLPAIYAMLRELSLMHRNYDPARYVLPDDVIAVYEPWMHRAMHGQGVLAIVAGDDPVTGYLVGEAIPAQGEYWSQSHLYIHDLYVQPQHRSSGVARALIAHAAAWATAQGITQVRGIVATDNGHARKFFRGAGFRESATELTLDL
jgi:ribosomal protein S18 acetylase RimI-like enzyme